MAINIQSIEILNTAGSATTVYSVPAPSGLSAADLDLYIGGNRYTAAPPVVEDSEGTYATIREDSQVISASNGVTIGAYYKYPPEIPAETVTGTVLTSRTAVYSRLRISGVDVSSPINVVSSSTFDVNAAPADPPDFTIPALTTTEDGCLAVAVLVWGSTYLASGPTANDRFTASGWDRQVATVTVAGATQQVSVAVYTKTIPTAGSTGTCVIVPNAHASTTTEKALGFMFALTPAPFVPSASRPIIQIF